MKKRFSDRIGVTKPSTVLQLNGMTDGLRNRIWNALREDALASWTQTDAGSLPLFEIIADRFLKLALDDIPRIANYQIQFLHEILLKRMEWYEVYNLIEFVIENYRQLLSLVLLRNFTDTLVTKTALGTGSSTLLTLALMKPSLCLLHVQP